MKLFKRKQKPIKTAENTYIPPMHIDDAKRKEWFTTYNIDLVNRIRTIKLNQV